MFGDEVGALSSPSEETPSAEETLSEQIRTLNQTISGDEANLTLAEEQINQTQGALDEATTRLGAAEGDLSNQRNNLETARQAVTSAQGERDRAVTEEELANQAYQEALAALQGAQGTEETLLGELATAQTAFDQAQNAFLQARARRDAAQQAVIQAQNALNNAQTQQARTRAQQRLAQARQRFRTNQQNFVVARTARNGAQGTLNTARENANAATARRQELGAEAGEKEAQLNQARTTAQSAQQRVEEAERNVQTGERAVEEALTQVNDAQARVTQAESDRQAALQARAEIEERLRDSRARRDALYEQAFLDAGYRAMTENAQELPGSDFEKAILKRITRDQIHLVSGPEFVAESRSGRVYNLEYEVTHPEIGVIRVTAQGTESTLAGQEPFRVTVQSIEVPEYLPMNYALAAYEGADPYNITVYRQIGTATLGQRSVLYSVYSDWTEETVYKTATLERIGRPSDYRVVAFTDTPAEPRDGFQAAFYDGLKRTEGFSQVTFDQITLVFLRFVQERQSYYEMLFEINSPGAGVNAPPGPLEISATGNFRDVPGQTPERTYTVTFI